MMSKTYNFNVDFDWAESYVAEDVALLQQIMPPLTHIQKADARLDKLGADYACVVLNFDEQRDPHAEAVYFVDIKRRRRGASQYWQRRAGQIVPEIAVELGTGGGLFKTPVVTDGLIYAFDPADCPFAIAVEFDELRRAALANRKIWRSQYRTFRQHNERGNSHYTSEVTYIPLPTIEAAGVRTAKILR